MKLTEIEKAIYERELEVLNRELRNGVEIIHKALAKYANGGGYSGNCIRVDDEKTAAAEFDKFVNNLRLGSVSYYDKYSLSVVAPNIAQAPEFLRKAILDYAIKDFMEIVNQIDEIRHIAENAANQ